MLQALQGLISRNFVTVRKADELSQPKDPDSYVVVIDAEGTPVALTTGEDIALGFPPENLFLADEGSSLTHLRQLRRVLEKEGFSPLGIGVMRGQTIVGIIPFHMLQEEKSYGLAQTPADAQYRCRRYPMCSEGTTVQFLHAPPLCPASSAHGHMVLMG